ncbi:putative Myb-like transcription factor-like protein [Coniochaeta sp. 2T2.1]|nr:putative Myb-like transcription factor-like protein [Coniochaeta sp. 2T2.1]
MQQHPQHPQHPQQVQQQHPQHLQQQQQHQGVPPPVQPHQQAPAAAAPPPVNQTPIQPPQQGAPAPPAGAPVPAAPAPTDDSTPQPPPAKKSRTNTPWTPAEELRLKQMRDAGNSWAEIAKTFPTRTEGSVKKHWYKDMHYAEFAEDESQALLNAIKEYENNKWKTIGQKVGKPAKACEQCVRMDAGMLVMAWIPPQ